jgi:hypothetical protein
MPYLIALIIVAVIGIGFAFSRSDNKTETTVATKQETENVPEQVATEETSSIDNEAETEPSTIPDGTHETTVTYFTPKRAEYLLNVSITTENGLVVDSKIEYTQGAENDPNAKKFEAAYKEVVIGKRLEDLNLSRVGGASLTTNAFNEAIDKILANNA